MTGRGHHRPNQHQQQLFTVKKPDLPLDVQILRSAATGFVCDGWEPRGTQVITRLLRQMEYGDALYSRNIWRVEWLKLRRGYPHYRVFHINQLVGVARMKANDHRETLIKYMAAYLVVLGFERSTCYLEKGGAKTSKSTSTERLPILFHVRYTGKLDQWGVALETEISPRGW